MIVAAEVLSPARDRNTGKHQLAGMIAYLQHILAAERQDSERFHAIFLDEKRGYLDDGCLADGSTEHLPVRLRGLFARALALGARGLIVAHNHPSGNCRPSASDIAATRRLVEIGRALEIELLDHLIITREKVYSMRAGGLL